MRIPKINFSNLARFTIVLSIVIVIINEIQFKSQILEWVAIALAILALIFISIFIIQFKKGLIKSPFQIILETSVENLENKEGSESVPKKIVINSNELFLNLVFNLAIANHFDLVPVDVLQDSIPNISPMDLMKFYNYSRSVSDDLNDYFRSQKYANKADVILHADEIKEYLAKSYPWMMGDTLENTYNYFFLGLGNG